MLALRASAQLTATTTTWTAAIRHGGSRGCGGSQMMTIQRRSWYALTKAMAVKQQELSSNHAYQKLSHDVPAPPSPPHYPTLEEVMDMPTSTALLSNEALATLGIMGQHDACCEMLKRHIMKTDRCEYLVAQQVFDRIQAANNRHMWLVTLPYKVGIGVAVTAAMASIPLVFHLGTAHWFNIHFVTTDVPEPRDLETALEVGAWTWNWMEPPLGQISFVLLCLQYARAQIENMGIKPYTRYIKHRRGEHLAHTFPQYDDHLLIAYSNSAPLYTDKVGAAPPLPPTM